MQENRTYAIPHTIRKFSGSDESRQVQETEGVFTLNNDLNLESLERMVKTMYANTDFRDVWRTLCWEFDKMFEYYNSKNETPEFECLQDIYHFYLYNRGVRLKKTEDSKWHISALIR